MASIVAEHILGLANDQADWLSRATVDHGEWQLHPDLFCHFCQRFGMPVVELFATLVNPQLPQFFSIFPA